MFRILLATVLVTGLAPVVPTAYAANTDKPTSVMLQIGDDKTEINVMKNVATLDSQKADTDVYLSVNDSYNNLGSPAKIREFILVDSSGKTVESLSWDNGNGGHFKIGKLKAGHKVVLVTSTREANSTKFVKRYEQELNVRVADTKAAESGSGNTAGISKDGSTWSFSNGLNYTFRNTGFKFLEGTTMTLSALQLPLQYKHNPDGTTIVGINCSPDDVAFYNAVKNGNVWQKYTSDKMVEMTKHMDRGFSGRNVGTWGGKGLDWNIMGYMEFNTKEPAAPRAVNLVISTGLKAEGHAQYLIFTGTLTFTIGGKATLTGKLTPPRNLEGKFNLGAYAGLELYIGLGLNYIASVGAYGKGQINIDFNILPETNLQSISLKGELGAKAKVFGFTVYTWSILNGSKQLYSREANTKKAPQRSQVDSDQERAPSSNADGTATSPLAVSADTAYPMDSSDYLNGGNTLVTAQSDALSAQASQNSNTILAGIYGEAEPVCVTTSEGPVIVYVADARQIDQSSDRNDANRSVVAYKRYLNGEWSDPRIIDTGNNFADYSPSVTADSNGNIYVSWLGADSEIANGATIGTVGNKLDVNVATIARGSDGIASDAITVETAYNESDTANTMPSSPKAVKVGDDLYVGWFTNETTGDNGQVLGMAGTHDVRLYKRNGSLWNPVKNVSAGEGAITSFDVGVYDGKAACAWTLDTKFSHVNEGTEITEKDGVERNAPDNAMLGASTANVLTSDAASARQFPTAANAKFATVGGETALTYALQGSDLSYSIMMTKSPSDTPVAILDGTKVNLPTPYYELAGDLHSHGNVSFLALADGSSDIQTLVTTGAGNADWTAVVEATVEQAAVTNYCATYYPNGTPLFIYMTEPVSENGSLSAQADDGSANMNQTTEESLKHLNIIDADFDEYAVKAGETMPITVYVENSGMLPVDGYKLWMLEDGAIKEMAASSETVPLDLDEDDDTESNDIRTISFNYTVPTKDKFTGKAHEFTLYAAPKNAAVTESTIKHALSTESAMTCSLGASSLALAADQQIIDGQESVAATVTNDGIVPHGAKLLFVNGDTGDVLQTVDVPELQEAETFNYTYSSPSGYFQNAGVKSIIVTLEEDGTENDGYEINNTEFISTWEVATKKGSTADGTAKPMPSKAVKTGDILGLELVALLAFIALGAMAGSYALHRRNSKE